jgi:hypothetical protein
LLPLFRIPGKKSAAVLMESRTPMVYNRVGRVLLDAKRNKPERGNLKANCPAEEAACSATSSSRVEH